MSTVGPSIWQPSRKMIQCEVKIVNMRTYTYTYTTKMVGCQFFDNYLHSSLCPIHKTTGYSEMNDFHRDKKLIYLIYVIP